MFFAPAAFAGIVIGSIIFGALTGHAINNNLAYNNPPPTAYVAPDPAPACVYHRTSTGHLVKVC